MSRFFGLNVPAKSTSNRNRAPFTAKQMVAKRALDLLLAGTALVILSPLLGLICLGIKVEGRHTSVLLQQHAEFNNREFAIYNFPTTAWEGASTVQGRRNYNRVTRVGHLLRATGLHELPQLFSVLSGQMSLVGPRPYPVDSNGQFSDPIALSPTPHQLKPGIIGWTQIMRLSREAASVEQLNQRVHFERWYIENWSIGLDLRILLRALVGEWVERSV